MVSIRRRKLLGLCSGRSLFLSPIPHVSENGQILQNHVEKATSVSVHPLPLSDDYAPKDGTSLEQDPAGSSNAGLFQQFPEIKRRKRHKRKHVENQEPCIMRGVYFKNSKWQAAIKVDKKQIHLGTVGSQEEAARLYDRAAFMCGRAPNFELSEEEKRQLGRYKWDEFLEFTRSSITSKKIQKRMASGLQRKRRNEEWDGEQRHSSISASEDDTSALAWDDVRFLSISRKHSLCNPINEFFGNSPFHVCSATGENRLMFSKHECIDPLGHQPPHAVLRTYHIATGCIPPVVIENLVIHQPIFSLLDGTIHSHVLVQSNPLKLH